VAKKVIKQFIIVSEKKTAKVHTLLSNAFTMFIFNNCKPFVESVEPVLAADLKNGLLVVGAEELFLCGSNGFTLVLLLLRLLPFVLFVLRVEFNFWLDTAMFRAADGFVVEIKLLTDLTCPLSNLEEDTSVRLITLVCFPILLDPTEYSDVDEMSLLCRSIPFLPSTEHNQTTK